MLHHHRHQHHHSLRLFCKTERIRIVVLQSRQRRHATFIRAVGSNINARQPPGADTPHQVKLTNGQSIEGGEWFWMHVTVLEHCAVPLRGMGTPCSYAMQSKRRPDPKRANAGAAVTPIVQIAEWDHARILILLNAHVSTHANIANQDTRRC